jgi:predicted nucleic acid-binding protein
MPIETSPDATCFVDSNVWLYATIISDDGTKTQKATGLVRANKSLIRISTQVVNEVSINLLRTKKFSEDQIRAVVGSFFRDYEIIPIIEETLVRASRLREKYSFSFWDSVIASTALQGKAKTLYSEDMQDRLVVEETMKIVNPFK